MLFLDAREQLKGDNFICIGCKITGKGRSKSTDEGG
jgi:hypothetical protein